MRKGSPQQRQVSGPRWSRRRFLAATGLLATGAFAQPIWRQRWALATEAQPPAIRPREDWAGGLVPQGPLEVEAPGDTRFLLVHHTATTNSYPADAVPGILQSIYRYHRGPKQWPDVAYNFFVDRYGGVWEGRSGSLDAPVRGSATGGFQGYAQLCTFVGDHTAEAPTPAAQDAMVGLLAFLAGRYDIDPQPGAQATFVSRGSNRWPSGHQVTTPTIAGHRDMSRTACPGDAAYALIAFVLPSRVTERRTIDGEQAPEAGATATPDPPPAQEPESPPVSPDTATDRSVRAPPARGDAPHRPPPREVGGAVDVPDPDGHPLGPLEVGGLAAALASLGVAGLAAARSRSKPNPGLAERGPRQADPPDDVI